MTDPRITDEAVEAAARTYFENLGWDWDELDTDLKDHGENKAAVLREFRAALEAALPHLAPQSVVDREALKQAIRKAANSEQSFGGATWVDGTLNDYTDAVLALINGSAS